MDAEPFDDGPRKDKGGRDSELAGLRAANPIAASPFVFVSASRIPPRRFVYGRHYARRYLSETVSAPGVGKSSLSLAEALAITTGRPLLGIRPSERTNVWIWNGEDPRDELQRRSTAAAQHYGIDPREFEGHLFVDSGRDMPLVIATDARGIASINQPTVDAITKTIVDNELGVVIIDPFIASHRVRENDNGAMELVAAAWAAIAEATECAIELVHHPRKTGGADVEAEDGRGGGAIIAKARSVRMLNGLSEREAAECGVTNAREYFRVQNGKANLTAGSSLADWFRFVSVDLDNGDNVGVVTACRKPSALSSVGEGDLAKAQAALAGGPWRANPQAKDWAGVPIAKALGLSLADKAGKAKVGGMLKAWTKAGHFVVVEAKDASRQARTFLEVGNAVAPSASLDDFGADLPGAPIPKHAPPAPLH